MITADEAKQVALVKTKEESVEQLAAIDKLIKQQSSNGLGSLVFHGELYQATREALASAGYKVHQGKPFANLPSRYTISWF